MSHNFVLDLFAYIKKKQLAWLTLLNTDSEATESTLLQGLDDLINENLHMQNILYGINSANRVKSKELVVQDHPVLTLRAIKTLNLRKQTNRH